MVLPPKVERLSPGKAGPGRQGTSREGARPGSEGVCAHPHAVIIRRGREEKVCAGDKSGEERAK